MTHPWSNLAGDLLVRAFTDARQLHIPPDVICGAALRCVAEVTRLLGVDEETFLATCRQVYAAAAEAQSKSQGGKTP